MIFKSKSIDTFVLLSGLLLSGALLAPLPATAQASSCTQLQDEQELPVISVHCGQAPSATLDEQGHLWVTFVQDKQVYVARSADKGVSFEPPVRVTPAPEDAEFNGENRPKILVHRKADGQQVVLLSWTTRTSANFTGEIRFSRSTDGGKTYTPPRTINDDNLVTGHRFDSLFLSEAGTLYLTWIDKRDLEASLQQDQDYAGAAIYYAVSRDLGKTFSQNYRVAHNSCECCRIAMAPYGKDQVSILWRQIFSEAGTDAQIRDHAIAVLAADGTVSYQQRASFDDWQINACPHHGPTMIAATQGDDYHMSWFSAGNNNRGITYARLDLSEGKHSQLMTVDASPGAGHPFLARQTDTLFLVWKTFDGSHTRLQLIRSNDEGQSWTETETLLHTTENSDHPLLVSSAEGVFLSWWTQELGYQFRKLNPLPATLSRKTATPTAAAPADSFQPFTAETFAAIKNKHAGKPFFVSLWSIDCPPCRIELDMLGNMLASHPDLPLVLISTDPISERQAAADILEEAGLAGHPSWIFADEFTQKLRYSIDPQWFGELPRSYYYDAAHNNTAHSGIMTREMLADFIKP
ncbi:MAG: hypothetical protein RQ757_06005 [Pseudomonadales bacterium]|nr:hypothetical protein [Pseudomonadales bacterium]